MRRRPTLRTVAVALAGGLAGCLDGAGTGDRPRSATATSRRRTATDTGGGSTATSAPGDVRVDLTVTNVTPDPVTVSVRVVRVRTPACRFADEGPACGASTRQSVAFDGSVDLPGDGTRTLGPARTGIGGAEFVDAYFVEAATVDGRRGQLRGVAADAVGRLGSDAGEYPWRVTPGTHRVTARVLADGVAVDVAAGSTSG